MTFSYDRESIRRALSAYRNRETSSPEGAKFLRVNFPTEAGVEGSSVKVYYRVKPGFEEVEKASAHGYPRVFSGVRYSYPSSNIDPFQPINVGNIAIPYQIFYNGGWVDIESKGDFALQNIEKKAIELYTENKDGSRFSSDLSEVDAANFPEEWLTNKPNFKGTINGQEAVEGSLFYTYYDGDQLVTYVQGKDGGEFIPLANVPSHLDGLRGQLKDINKQLAVLDGSTEGAQEGREMMFETKDAFIEHRNMLIMNRNNLEAALGMKYIPSNKPTDQGVLLKKVVGQEYTPQTEVPDTTHYRVIQFGDELVELYNLRDVQIGDMNSFDGEQHIYTQRTLRHDQGEMKLTGWCSTNPNTYTEQKTGTPESRLCTGDELKKLLDESVKNGVIEQREVDNTINLDETKPKPVNPYEGQTPIKKYEGYDISKNISNVRPYSGILDDYSLEILNTVANNPKEENKYYKGYLSKTFAGLPKTFKPKEKTGGIV